MSTEEGPVTAFSLPCAARRPDHG